MNTLLLTIPKTSIFWRNCLVGAFFVLFSVGLSAQITIDFQITEPSCNGFTDGSVLATITGGDAPLTLSWNTGDDGLGIFGIGAGTYTLSVTDTNGNTAEATADVSEPEAVVGAIDFVGSICINPGDILASGSGGSEPYTFSWNDGVTTAQRSGLDDGIYCVTVTDANGCSDNACIVVPVSVNLTLIGNAPSCQGGMDGSAVVIAQGGEAPYSYSWSNGGTNSNIINLLPGSFFVTVIDANGCLAFGSVDVPEGTSDLDLDITAVDPECPGTGSISVNPMGGEPPYSYEWSTGEGTPSIENLAGGMLYFLTVTDNNGCRQTESIFLTANSTLAVSVTVDYTCGNPAGTATAFPIGGTGPYTYAWTNGQTTSMATNLSPGQIYEVSVSDATGCTVSRIFAVADDNQLDVEVLFDFVAPLCNGWCDASATAIVPGVDPASLNYIWNTGETTQTIFSLPAGVFSVTVYDDNGCGGSGTLTIEDPEPLTLDIAISEADCGFSNSGSAFATVTGGTEPYTYIWSTGDDGPSATGLNAGTYTLRVVDANGCEVEQEFTIEGSDLEVTISVSNAECGSATGSALAIASGGTPPYTYSWDDPSNQMTAEATGLAPGTYTVMVMDANGCEGSASATIIEIGAPACSIAVNSPISAQGASDGEVQATASGGTPPYTYLWNNGETTEILTGLSAGTYTVTITDAADCSTTCSVTLEDPSAPCIPLTDPGEICCSQELCGPGNVPDPFVNVELPSGGDGGPIEYLWMKSNSGGPFNSAFWESIPNSNSPEYAPGPIFETTYFARCARIDGCGSFLETNIVEVIVREEAVAAILPPGLPICVDEMVNFQALDNGPDATYLWNFGPGAVPMTSTEQNPTVYWISMGIRNVSLMVTVGDCTSSAFKNISITTGPVFCGSGLTIEANPNGDGNVDIAWEMEVRHQEQRYIVESSDDGEDFDEIAEVILPMDQTEYEFVYQYEDEHPKFGRSFYRVKFLDLISGEMVYSNIEPIMISPKDERFIFVYPNPFRQRFFVELIDENINPEDVTLEVQAATGTKMAQAAFDAGAYRKSIDMEFYPTGVYFVRVQVKGKDMKTIRVVKIYD